MLECEVIAYVEMENVTSSCQTNLIIKTIMMEGEKRNKLQLSVKKVYFSEKVLQI